MKKKIFVIDDSKTTLDLLERIITQEGYYVEVFIEGAEAIKRMKDCKPDVVILDLAMPTMGGAEAMNIIKEAYPEIKIVIMTAFADNKYNEYFLKKGAMDFIAKPFLPKNIMTVLQQCFSSSESVNDKRLSVIGQSPAIRECLDKCLKVSNTNLPLLILGESGAGKEMLADFIHYNSIRKYNSLIKINCSTIPEHLVENELFGHEKGAFTGANETVAGKIEQAHNGTLFLDEIGEIDMGLQKKMLRILENKSFERLGGNKIIQSDFRLICATNRDLAQEVAAKRFREDLYYRINTVTVVLPPLRERREDIRCLALYFFEKYKQEYGMLIEKISEETLAVLQNYNWPGNIRELKGTIYSMVSLCTKDVIGEEDIPINILNSVKYSFGSDAYKQELTLDEVEKIYILDVVEKTGGHKNRAAAILGISEKTLYNKLQKYGIQHC